MTTDTLLYRLRARLQMTEIRIAATEDFGRMAGFSLCDVGILSVLRSERTFLIDLIAQIEREGVTAR